MPPPRGSERPRGGLRPSRDQDHPDVADVCGQVQLFRGSDVGQVQHTDVLLDPAVAWPNPMCELVGAPAGGIAVDGAGEMVMGTAPISLCSKIRRTKSPQCWLYRTNPRQLAGELPLKPLAGRPNGLEEGDI